MRDNREEDGNLDEAALLEMVEKKQGKHKNTSEKVCKHFLDAVENSKYGWFWECPNGDGCLYRHALPPGFILKKDRKKMEKQREEISLEELVDRERAALGPNTTKVTLETFMAWKKRKLKEKEEKEKKDSEKKKKDFSAGKNLGLSGREMFTFNPNLISGGDEMEEGDESFDVRNMEKDPENEDEDESRFEFKEIDMSALMSEYQEIDTSAKLSIAKPDRLSQLEEEVKKVKAADVGAVAAEAAAEAAAVDIDEELFDGDDEDLDDLEEQLGEMTVT